MLDIPGLNRANYRNCITRNAVSGNVTAVGRNGGPSYYGTYDQGGNVAEWIEDCVSFSGYNGSGLYAYSQLAIGGSFSSTQEEISILNNQNNVGIHNSNNYNALTLKNNIGFRVCSVNNPLNLPNFVVVSRSEPLNFNGESRIFGISESNVFFSIMPEDKVCTSLFATGSIYNNGNCDALAYNYDKNQLFFIYNGNGNSSISGLYSWNLSSTNPSMPKVVNATNFITTSISNADYYASGYWYFKEGTDQLNKVVFSYNGSNVPTATGQQTWNINLDISSTNNLFGDIAIDKNGKLYSSVSGNILYTIDLLPTTTGAQPIYINQAPLTIAGNPASITPSLQLAINYDGSKLYGHDRSEKKWYSINTNNVVGQLGELTEIKTVDGLSNFLTPGFRDISGNSPLGISGINSNYLISSIEVTNQDYAIFLNSVDPSGNLASITNQNNQFGQLASTGNAFLYHGVMSTSTYGGINYNNSLPLGSGYTVLSKMENKPVNYVTAFMAMRYCNWLHNRVTNNATTNTSNGAYNLNYVPSFPGETITRTAGAKYFLPTKNEWIAAGYYSLNILDKTEWSYTNNNPFSNSSELPIGTADEIPVTTGWKILTNGVWSTVTEKYITLNEAYPTRIVISPGTFNTNENNTNSPGIFEFYAAISGYNNYSTQNDIAPCCSNIDQHGNGPELRNVGHLVSFNGLVPGVRYTANFTLHENSDYYSFIDNPTVTFIASSTTEQIMVQITKHWPIKMIILNTKLTTNDMHPNVHSENTTVIRCNNTIIDDCNICN